MTQETKSKLQLFGAWCGILYLILVVIGWGGIAGLLPPTHPYAAQDEIAPLFQSSGFRIRVGMIITMFAALILIPFGAVLAQMLARIEGGPGVLTYTMLLGAAADMVLTFYPPTWWLIGAFRPDRSPVLLYLIDDVAWLQFIGGLSIFMAMPVATMVAAFCDASPNPVFPRWSGYANLWMILLMLPDQLLWFFHAGPFSWNGAVAFWIPLVVFGAWFTLTALLVRSAVLRDRRPAGVLSTAFA